MLRNYKFACLFSLVIMGILSLGEEAEASSDLTITIVENPLTLTEVIPPTFGSYIKSSDERLVTATGDLIIKVKDTRLNRDTPWSIQYQLTAFTNQTEYGLQINLGEGQLTSDLAEGLTYESYGTSLLENQKGTLVEVYSTNTEEYQYRISKEAIQLVLPGGLPIGEYHGVQTINLVNISEPQ
ncbi:hypothetical protein [Enterococcus sp. LJL90]